MEEYFNIRRGKKDQEYWRCTIKKREKKKEIQLKYNNNVWVYSSTSMTKATPAKTHLDGGALVRKLALKT